MKLTKDECIILAHSLEDYKYSISRDYQNINCYGKIEDLQTKLFNYGEDKRRCGRRSKNQLSDILKRYISK